MHGLVDPPAEQHDERHPEERKLDAEVNRARHGELLGHHQLLAQDVVDHPVPEEHEVDAAARRERDDRQ